METNGFSIELVKIITPDVLLYLCLQTLLLSVKCLSQPLCLSQSHMVELCELFIKEGKNSMFTAVASIKAMFYCSEKGNRK